MRSRRVARSVPVVGFAAWTLFVWGTRLRNIAGDDDLSTGGRVARYALALSFVGLAVACVARPARPVLVVAAGWTVAVWVVRVAGIATGGHSAAFVLVHAALGLVSIGLAAWALGSVTPDRRAPSRGRRPGGAAAGARRTRRG